MLRARYPLAVAMLAATLTIPATSALAGENDVQSAVDTVTTSASPSPSQSSAQRAENSQTQTATPEATPTSSAPSESLTTANPLTDGLSQLQDAASSLQNSGDSGSSPDIAGALQTFGTCLEEAGNSTTPALDGQVCVENLVKAITGDSRANCLSENGFTLQFLIDRLQSGQPPTEEDLTKFQTMLTGLLDCLAASPSQSSEPTTTSGGGGATSEPAPTATSDVAPAATPVVGTPNFTG